MKHEAKKKATRILSKTCLAEKILNQVSGSKMMRVIQVDGKNDVDGRLACIRGFGSVCCGEEAIRGGEGSFERGRSIDICQMFGCDGGVGRVLESPTLWTTGRVRRTNL